MALDEEYRQIYGVSPVDGDSPDAPDGSFNPVGGYSVFLPLAANTLPPVRLPGAVWLSVGLWHSCAVNEAGGVKCWGGGVDGQLGDGNQTVNSRTPVDVFGLQSGVAAVAAGGYHTCALTRSGAVKCWGNNIVGQLGDGTTTRRLTPVDVQGLSGVTAIAAGNGFTCAITNAGSVKCWGDNSGGQLGDGTCTTRLTPVDVAGIDDVAAIMAGAWHACALTATGGAKCWGYNYWGQLGDGTTGDQNHQRGAPVDVQGLSSGVAMVATGGGFSCALTTSGGVQCWGIGNRGELGDGRRQDSLYPVNVSGLSNGITTIGVGADFAFAVPATRRVKGWGDNSAGQLAELNVPGPWGWRVRPIDLPPAFNEVAAIDGGLFHVCALTTYGAVMCWGNGTGESYNKPRYMPGFAQPTPTVTNTPWPTSTPTRTPLPTRTPTPTSTLTPTPSPTATFTPTPTPTITPTSTPAPAVTAIGVGGHHTCALTMGGGAKCWGLNNRGQLGDGTMTDRLIPVDVSGLSSGVTAISAGGTHTCALTVGGGVKCWGRNHHGQLGDGTMTDHFVPGEVVSLGSGVQTIAAGDVHTCALTVGGGVKCWGANGLGELGDGTGIARTTPVEVVGLQSGITAIAVGGRHTCALTVGGGVKCWGWNYRGQVGDGPWPDRLIPVDVFGLSSGVTAISAGGEHTCALTVGGGVKCWGRNHHGQLGDGTDRERRTPVDVQGLSTGVTAVSAGSDHTCALRVGGGVKCWGNNIVGQLGDGTTTERRIPVDVFGLQRGVAAIFAGSRVELSFARGHTCALTVGGEVKCWGWNADGQLGDGTTTDRWTPVDLVWP